MEPTGFNQLDEKTLARYAEVFDITVGQLRKTE
jgi:hypothetical protein